MMGEKNNTRLVFRLFKCHLGRGFLNTILDSINLHVCRENKDAEQRGYHLADMSLCFHICLKPGFS